MKDKQRNLLLVSYALAELKTLHNLNPDDIIPGYKREKASEFFNEQFPQHPTKDQLTDLVLKTYKKLKIK